MQPNLVLNWTAILVSVLAAFFLGFLWFGPLFGKPWAKLMGMKMTKKPDGKTMARLLGIQLFGTFLTAFVIAHTIQVWRPSVWGVGQDDVGYMYGFYCAFFTWIGFYVPLQLGKVTWENRPWKLFLINSGHDLSVLLIISQILANWR